MKKMMDHPARRLALGAGVSMACYLGLTALLSLLLVQGVAGENTATVCMPAFGCLSAFAGAKLASKACEAKYAAFASAATFWAVTALLGFLVNDTLEPSRAATLALSSAIGAALACMGRGKSNKRMRGERGRRTHR